MEEFEIIGGCLLTVCLEVIGLRLAAGEIEEKFSRKVAMVMSGIQVVLMLILWLGCGKESFMVLKYLVMTALLGICAWSDWKKHLILNHTLLAGIILRILLIAGEFLYYGVDEWKFILTSAAVAAVMFLIASLLCKVVATQGVGFGDVKLLFVFGLYAGTDMGIQIIFITFVILFAVAVFLLITKRATRKSVIPFAPFLYAGAIASVIMLGI